MADTKLPNDRLAGLKNKSTIEHLVVRAINAKQWREVTEKEVYYELGKNERHRKADVIAFIREGYDAAGAGYSGRFQR